eukprot:jgi/Chrzof1/6628/Cz19g03090.t1
MAGLRVMSFNVRWDNPEDGDDRWDNRRDTVADTIRTHQPQVFGLQEPHKNQVEDLANALPDYAWVGYGRVPVVMGLGEKHCEYNPLFYNTTQLTLDDWGQIWLSDTPQIPATKFSGSAFPRIAVWGRFTVNADGRKFCFINTHFDHEGEEPRQRSAQLLLEKIPAFAGGPDVPVVLVGDLNCGAESTAYSTLVSNLKDVSACCDGTCEGLMATGTSTFCGFDHSIESCIDFIFTNNGFTVTSYGVVPATCPNGHCVSDHRPVLADLAFAA